MTSFASDTITMTKNITVSRLLISGVSNQPVNQTLAEFTLLFDKACKVANADLAEKINELSQKGPIIKVNLKPCVAPKGVMASQGASVEYKVESVLGNY